MKKICRYCNREVEFEKIQQFAGHVSNCNLNPNKAIKFKKLSEKLKGRRPSNIRPLVEYKVNCLKCGDEFTVKVTKETFEKGNYKKNCSYKCANSKKKTEDSKRLTSLSMKNSEKVKLARRNRISHFKHGNCIPKEKECEVCKKTFISVNRTCSRECCNKLLGILMSERLSKVENRLNYGRYKRSYLEVSFEEWLKSKNIIDYETEKRFYNSELKKSYYADFVFQDKKLIVELDGTQHLKTIIQDEERDEYITKNFGYRIIRVSYKEYINKNKEQLLLKLLS